jgi:hypothetical protein
MTRGVGGRSPSNISHHLRGIGFPANKQDLLRHAHQGGADEEVIEVLKQMPDQQYGNMADVMKGVGQVE